MIGLLKVSEHDRQPVEVVAESIDVIGASNVEVMVWFFEPFSYAFSYYSNFGGSRSFKVIDVNIPKKLVATACYDKQHVCAYLRPFPR